MWFEIAIIMTIFAVGNVLFGHFEAGTPKWRRLSKMFLVTGVSVAISNYAGQSYFWIFLALIFLAAIYIHVCWLPRHGINGWTGEPKSAYYKLRGWKLPDDKEQTGT